MIATLLLAASTLTVSGAGSLALMPPDITFQGQDATQQLILIQRTPQNGSEADLTPNATFTSSSPGVARVDTQGLVRALGDGETRITARLPDGRQTSVLVQVKSANQPPRLDFRNQVRSVMTKSGCNSGPCHGAGAGQNFFKLSLRGYSLQEDFRALTREAGGRRISRQEPSRSLILLKPTLAVSHGGGKLLETDSLDYRIMADWIAGGAKGPAPDDPRVERLEVYPSQAMLRPGVRHRLVVRAFYSDGRTEDVTRWGKYTSSDASVAKVGQDGMVETSGHGEATLSVWYLDRIAMARFSVPFPDRISEQVFRKAARHNFIDDLVLEKLQQMRIPPSELCTDSEFLRRAYLDAAGILPSGEEAKRFAADPDPGKRRRLVEALLQRSEFVDLWAYKWSDLLLVSSSKLTPAATRTFHGWIRQAVAENKPWDRFVREIITASGSNLANGAANYYLLHDEPTVLAENMTLTFMGISINCARCHNHPLDKWTQDDYYHLSSFFSRVGRKNDLGYGFTDNPNSLKETTIFTASRGEVIHPLLGRPLPPRPLESVETISDRPGRDRRLPLAQWLTSGENRYFVRAVVNRVWHHFMGRGLVHPADDMRETNVASNPPLLDALGREFVRSGFDLKSLIRTIVNSATYQRSSRPQDNSHDRTYYSHYLIRRLPAEVLLDVVSQALGVPESFAGHPEGVRALQLPDSRVSSYALTLFGRPSREINAYSERVRSSTVPQVLHLLNGELLSAKLRSPEGDLQRMLDQGLTDREIVRRIFWTSLSRPPSPGEEAEVLEMFDPDGDSASSGDRIRRELLEDFWAGVMMSKEFLFNH
ncbi:MAG: DUF1553 domain-containing protein [Candidatus Aminicenantes bacterium]|nr:DUF1553 domain-containing protein [Candidatus Aminicenantes bacterium]